MIKNYCIEEQRVLEAVQSDAFDPVLNEHITHCAICAEIVLVAEYLGEQKKLEKSEVVLPNAGLLWWKAEVRSRDAAMARATRPIALVTKAGSAAIALAGIWFASTSSAAREWIINLATLQHAAVPYWGILALTVGTGTILCALVSSLVVLRS